MNKIFIVRVEEPSKNSNEPFMKVYERQIPFDDSLMFSISSVYASMRLLYGDDCLVSFIVY